MRTLNAYYIYERRNICSMCTAIVHMGARRNFVVGKAPERLFIKTKKDPQIEKKSPQQEKKVAKSSSNS